MYISWWNNPIVRFHNVAERMHMQNYTTWITWTYIHYLKLRLKWWLRPCPQGTQRARHTGYRCAPDTMGTCGRALLGDVSICKAQPNCFTHSKSSQVFPKVPSSSPRRNYHDKLVKGLWPASTCIHHGWREACLPGAGPLGWGAQCGAQKHSLLRETSDYNYSPVLWVAHLRWWDLII